MQIIGSIDIVAPRVPLIQVDAPEVDHPHHRRPILDHRKVDDAARAVFDRAGLDPGRAWHGRALHEEERPRCAIRVPLHHHRAATDVRQQNVCHRGVVLQQIAFREAQLWPEDLAQIGEADFFAVDLQDDRVLIARDRERACRHA